MIKESFNLIGQETQLATPDRKWYSAMLPFLDNYLPVKSLRYQLIPYRDIDDQESCNSIERKTQLAAPSQKT